MYAICMFIVKFVERYEKADKVVDAFHFQFLLLETKTDL